MVVLLEVARSIVGLPEISPVSAQHLVWRDLVNLSVHSITSVPATLNSLAEAASNRPCIWTGKANLAGRVVL